MGVASHMLATVPELEKYLSGRNPVCDSLVGLYKEYRTDFAGSAKGKAKMLTTMFNTTIFD